MTEAGAVAAAHWPSGVSRQDRVVLFDGVCKLCNGWTRFVIRFDQTHRYRLATVQSEAGTALLRWCGLPTDRYDTFVLIEDGVAYVRSTAGLRILAGMGGLWRLAVLGYVIPRSLRDRFYDLVARNRYRWFGRYDVCMLPTPDHLARFLDAT